MPKVYSAKIIALSANLECGHCECKFAGSHSQAFKVFYEKRVVYCSATCRHAALRDKFSTPVPEHTCKNCGTLFASRVSKLYCSMDCYVTSPQMKQHMADIAAMVVPKGKRQLTCLECDCEYDIKNYIRTNKFCSQSCYRKYLAKRFDRYIASPETVSLPQNYDEFLTKDLLPCLVEGCSWEGHALSNHMNAAHGIVSTDFKRAAGFNIGSGIVSGPMREALEARANVGIALGDIPIPVSVGGRTHDYKSLEGKEHRRKSRIMFKATTVRNCRRCGVEFNPNAFSQHWCSKEHRLADWHDNRKPKV